MTGKSKHSACDDLHIDIRANPGHPPLLMLNGIGSGLATLEPLVNILEHHFEIVRIDAPGTGNSPTRLVPSPFPQLATQVHELLGRLGYSKIDVLGYSWGGVLAQQLAIQHPQRIRRLVLVSTTTGATGISGPYGPLSLFSEAAEPPQAADAVRRRLIKKQLITATTFHNYLGYAYQLIILGSWTTLPQLHFIRQRTLVMNGRTDKLVPMSNARIIASLIPNSRLQFFDGGHLAIISRAGTIGEAVSTFLLPIGEDDDAYLSTTPRKG